MNRMFTPTQAATPLATFPRRVPVAAPMTDAASRRFAIAASASVLGVSLVFRVLWLDRLPGINGDEAWYGVQAARFVAGEPWTVRTPTGLVANPLLFLTESLLLCIFEPSFWVLRLPIAIWAAIGLALTYVLHRWVYGDPVEAIVVAALTSCLPAHLAYSRFCWDGSFAFVSLPLVIYPLLKFASGDRTAKTIGLFAAASLLAIWIHVTHVVLVLAGALCVVWDFREPIAARVRRLPITTTAALIALVVVSVVVARKSRDARILVESMASSLDRLPQHLASLADVLLGGRVYEYLSGMPMPAWIRWTYPLFYLGAALVLWQLHRRGTTRDRRLAMLSVAACLLILLAGRALRLHMASYERYILYLVPLCGLLLVRGIRAMSGRGGERLGPWATALPLGVAMLLLVQFWSCYFRPLCDQRFASRLHRTFLSGDQEPKAGVAAAIRARLRPGTTRVVVAQDWWVQYPVDYLLAGRCEVRLDGPEGETPRDCFVVGFADSDFIRDIRAAASDRHELREELTIGPAAARPILALLVLGPPTEIDGPP